jgi:hypothetical protein
MAQPPPADSLSCAVVLALLALLLWLAREQLAWSGAWRRRLIGCAALGALTAFAVAAAFALIAPEPAQMRRTVGASDEGGAVWVVERREETGITWLDSRLAAYRRGRPLFDPDHRAEDLLPRWTSFCRRERVNESTRRRIDARGWPLRSFWTGYEFRLEAGSPSAQSYRIAWPGLALPGAPAPAPRTVLWRGGRAIPLRPVPGGFLLDTALYGVAWACMWALAGSPWTLRRIRRRRHGRCPRCAYDLRGGPPRTCPECGWRQGAG